MFSNDNSRALVNYSLIVLTLVLSNAANSPVGYNPLVAPAPQNSNDTAYAEASSSTLPLPTTLKLSVSRQTAPPTISPYSGVDSARVTDPQPLASSPAAIPSESELKGILPGVVKSLRPLVGSISHTLSATAQQSPQVGAGKNGCQTAECFIKYPTADVYYWPTGTPNTACLSTITNRPTTPAQRYTNSVSPSVVVVFATSPTAYDGCGNRIATTVQGLGATMTFGPGALSTVVQGSGAGPSPVPKVYNFTDYPCPPPDIQSQLEPGAAYFPLLYLNDRKDFWVSEKFPKCKISNVPDGNEPAHPVVAGNMIPEDRSFY